MMTKKQNNYLAIRFNNTKVYVNKSIAFQLSPVIFNFMKENPSLIFQIENSSGKKYIHLFLDIFRGKSFQITAKNLQFLIDLFQDLQVTKFDLILGNIQEQLVNSIDTSSEFQDITTFYNLVHNLDDDNFLETVARCEELVNRKIDSSSIVNLLFNFFITKPDNIDLYLRFSLEFEVLKISLLRQLHLLLSVSSSCDVIYIAAKFIEYKLIDSREILLILKSSHNDFYLNLLSFILSPKKHNFRLKNRDELRALCLSGESQNKLIKIIKTDNISEFQLLTSDPNFDIDSTQFFTYQDLYFEKIRMLHKKNLSCIEIAAYFCSIQIFKFLLMSNARTTDRLAKFAIAGGNNEIIHLCDQKKCNFSNCLKYALKYDHYELFEWLIDSKGCKLFDDSSMSIREKVSIFLGNSFFTVIPSPEIFQSMIKRFMNDEIIAVLIASIHRGFFTYVSVISKIINCLDTSIILVNCNLYSMAIKCGSIETYRLVRSNAELRNFIKKISLKKNINYSFNFYTTEENIYNLKVYTKSEKDTNNEIDNDDDDEIIIENPYKVPSFEFQTSDLYYEDHNNSNDNENNRENNNNNDNENSNENNNNINDDDNENSNENNNNINDDDNENSNENNNNINDDDNENSNENNNNINDDDNENSNENNNNNSKDKINNNDNETIYKSKNEKDNENDIDEENSKDNDKENTDNNNENDTQNEDTNGNQNTTNNYGTGIAHPSIQNENYISHHDYEEEEEEEEEYNDNDNMETNRTNENTSSITINDFTDLHIACFSGNSEAVDDILYENLDKNLKKLVNSYPTNYTTHDYKNFGVHLCCTPLHAASLSKSYDSVFLLLATNECEVNSQGNKNMTALHNSVLNDCVDVFKLIYNWPGVDQKPLMFRQKLPFHLAAKFGSVKILRYIIDETKNFDVNEKAAQGMTALHYACKYNQKEIVSDLLKIPECNVNLKTDDKHFTALHFACQNCDIEIVRILVERKDIKLNEKDINNETPLILAIKSKFIDVVSFLINCDGIDLSVPSLLLAACIPPDSLINESIDQINSEIVKMLLTKKEINVNCRTKDKKLTPLHIAALNNNFETVKVLMRSDKIIRKPHDIFYFSYSFFVFFSFFYRFQFFIFYEEPLLILLMIPILLITLIIIFNNHCF